jgi:transposase-like protein
MSTTHPTTPAPNGDPCLERFACPNPDCDLFNRFAASNLSVVGCIGKQQTIRRLYCHHCGQRFSERKGTLLQGSKLPQPAIIRIVKCLSHGCSVEAAADICDVDPRTVEKLLHKAGLRAEDFHHLQLDRLQRPLQAIEFDELHARVSPTAAKKGGAAAAGFRSRSAAAAVWVGRGFTRPWQPSAAS